MYLTGSDIRSRLMFQGYTDRVKQQQKEETKRIFEMNYMPKLEFAKQMKGFIKTVGQDYAESLEDVSQVIKNVQKQFQQFAAHTIVQRDEYGNTKRTYYKTADRMQMDYNLTTSYDKVYLMETQNPRTNLLIKPTVSKNVQNTDFFKGGNNPKGKKYFVTYTNYKKVGDTGEYKPKLGISPTYYKWKTGSVSSANDKRFETSSNNNYFYNKTKLLERQKKLQEAQVLASQNYKEAKEMAKLNKKSVKGDLFGTEPLIIKKRTTIEELLGSDEETDILKWK